MDISFNENIMTKPVTRGVPSTGCWVLIDTFHRSLSESAPVVENDESVCSGSFFVSIFPFFRLFRLRFVFFLLLLGMRVSVRWCLFAFLSRCFVEIRGFVSEFVFFFLTFVALVNVKDLLIELAQNGCREFGSPCLEGNLGSGRESRHNWSYFSAQFIKKSIIKQFECQGLNSLIGLGNY